MHPLLTRALLALALVLGGGWLGARLGAPLGQAPAAAVGGCVLGLLVALLIDALHAARLLRWLRGEQREAAPTAPLLWGELGYRIERGLHQREQALRREEQRLWQFLRAIEASPNGVVLLDARDQIEWCNGVAADQLGLDPQRDRQQRLGNLVRAPALAAWLRDAQASAEPLLMPAPGGEGRQLSLLLRPYGQGQRLLLTQDITARERLHAMQRDFVANVSHEIRTPLTVLAGFVETLATMPLAEPERARVLELMTQQAQRMQALVADLLTLAALEGSPRPPVDAWVDARELLQALLDDAQALSKGRHRLTLELALECQLAGSREELLSAVGNLVHNAVRYTPAQGHIALRLRGREDGGVELEVVDDGPGIAREHLPRLAERFYRVDSSRSRASGGTGLGLSIVKHVAQRHGGELQVHSELGVGTRMRIVLPAARVRA
ncbi:MAG: phosphate regulon sensor histidine kinase PhoR [Burkholderiales bacterium]|nr:phosphate regulon sensor histidine kinase PhoR [Burkholderiales bacterium]